MNNVDFLLRISFQCFNTPEKTAKLIEFCKAAGISKISAIPIINNEPAFLSRPEITERCRELKEHFAILEKANVEVHINVLRTFMPLSTPGVEKQNIGFEQHRIDIHGRSEAHTPCPLDKHFIDYTKFHYRNLALTGTRTLQVDDDFRYQNLRMGSTCFCPLHLNEFARRNGRHFSREELVEYLNDEKPNDIKAVWMDFKRQLLLEFAVMLRENVHDAAPGVRLGLMCTSTAGTMPDARDMRELVNAFAGDQRPWCRPGQGYYYDTNRIGILNGLAATVFQKSQMDENCEIFAELDAYPHTEFCKSPQNTLGFQIMANLACGMKSLSIWPFAAWDSPEDKHPYAAILMKNNPVFKSAMKMLPEKPLMRGIQLKCNLHNGFYLDHTRGNYRKYFEMNVLLWRFGLPWTYDESDTVLLSRGSLPLSRDELKVLLENKNVIIDGETLAIVTGEGNADLFAAAASGEMTAVAESLSEKIVEDPLNGSAGGMDNGGECVYKLEFPQNEFKVLSYMCDIRGSHTYPGIITRTLPSKRKLIICAAAFPEDTGGFKWHWLSLQKQRQIRALFEYSAGTLEAYVEGAPDVCVTVLDEADGSFRAIGLLNVSVAAMSGFNVMVANRDESYKHLTYLDDDGSIAPMPEDNISDHGDYLCIHIDENLAVAPQQTKIIRLATAKC